MEQLWGSLFVFVLGFIYLLFFKKVGDFVIEINYQLHNGFFKRDRKPTKWSFFVARLVAFIQAASLAYFGGRGLVLYFFNV